MGFRWLNRYHPCGVSSHLLLVSIMQEVESFLYYCSKNLCAVFKRLLSAGGRSDYFHVCP
jgi:hypothetical protein